MEHSLPYHLKYDHSFYTIRYYKNKWLYPRCTVNYNRIITENNHCTICPKNSCSFNILILIISNKSNEPQFYGHPVIYRINNNS